MQIFPDPMIPSDLPPVSHPEPRSLGENGNYGDVPSILQHAEQLMRSQLLGQLPQQQLSQLPQLLTKLPGPAPDQLQMLQSLQQFGQRQKEVRDAAFIITPDFLLLGTHLTFCCRRRPS